MAVEDMLISHAETLARHEERLAEGKERMDKMDAMIAKADQRVDAIDGLVQMLTKSNSTMTRVVWGVIGGLGVVVTGVVVAILTKFIMG